MTTLKELLARRGVIVRKIKYGGLSKEDLLKRLIAEGIHLNEYAKTLLGSDMFETSPSEETADIVINGIFFVCNVGTKYSSTPIVCFAL